jgi:hypothetical protein
MRKDNEARVQLVNALTLAQAHMTLDEAVTAFPPDNINTRPPFCNYTFWQLLEHIRFCQHDILEYATADSYVCPRYPDDLWLPVSALSDLDGWNGTLAAIYHDRQQLIDTLNDPATDIYAPLPNSGEDKHSLLREILILSAHNSYHIGEIVALRQALGIWLQA